MGPLTAVVVSEHKAIKELMDVRGASTADRPLAYGPYTVTNGCYFVFLSVGSVWRVMRRSAHDLLIRDASARHLPIQYAEACQAMHDPRIHFAY